MFRRIFSLVLVMFLFTFSTISHTEEFDPTYYLETNNIDFDDMTKENMMLDMKYLAFLMIDIFIVTMVVV